MAADNASQRADLEAWQMLQAWLSQDKEGQVLLSQIKSGERIEIALKQWIKARQTEVPPRLTTYVSGGQLGKLVNIAQAQNVYFYPDRPLLSRQEYRNRRELLNEVKREVLGRLRQSLHNAVLINLQKESQPQQVRQPWDVEVKIGEQTSYQLSPGTDIIEVFDQEEITGRLLILGAPGSGKTTTQLELAQALITGAENDDSQPIPVLFNLASWKDDKQPIADWLVAELKSKYGVGVDIGRKLVENRQLLPLLDGLDEVEPERQEQCVQAINQLLGSEQRPQYLVVCSRLEEYESCDTELQLNGAICLQPLTEAQIHQYLVDVKRSELWQYIQNDPSLLELVRSPLLLSIMTLAYKELSIQEWQRLDTTPERLEYLFNGYIRRMLAREIKNLEYGKGKEPKPEQTKRWLVWLAKRLKAESQTEFLIEKMQATWLPTRSQKQMHRLGVVLLWGLLFGLNGGLFWGLISWPIEGSFWGLLFGLVGGLISGLIGALISWFTIEGGELSEEIKPVESLKWSWVNVRKGLIRGLKMGLISGLSVGLISGLIFWLISRLSNGQIDGLRLGLGGGLSLGVSLGVMFGLSGGLDGGLSGPDIEIERRTVPNYGIWKSAANAGIFGLIFGLIFAPIFGLIFGLTFELILRLSYSLSLLLISMLISGLALGLTLGLGWSAGRACIKHFILRVLLWRNNCIPWNYARFLDYATERLFLQRVGGRYRFVHALLREHFAQMNSEQLRIR